MYLKSATFKQDHRCFTKGETFDFNSITLLVGDQGCGKSTLISLLLKPNDDLRIDLTHIGKFGVDSFYFDSEKMNPRINDPNIYVKPDGTNKGIGVGVALSCRFKSHGEVLQSFTVDALKKACNCVILLDEPESGLSIRNQFRLINEIKLAAERQCQLIIATHSFLLIENIDNVLSLEHKRWLPSSDFLREQMSNE